MNQEGIAAISGHIAALAEKAFSRGRPDRTSETGALESAVLSLLGWVICEGRCVVAGLESQTP